MQRGGNGQVLPAARQAGVCLHVTALPGRHGIGEIGATAFAFVDRMRRMGLHVWQFLPLGPTAYGDSPYQPLSTFAGNELLIDVDDLSERGFLKRDEAWALTSLPADYVDYGRLIPAKSELLRLAADRFQSRASSRQKGRFDSFMDRHDDNWLHEYALFRILKAEHQQRPWTEWQGEFVHHDDAALKRLEASQARRIEAIKIVQFLFYDQWQRLRTYAHESGVRLFGDMPIYIAHDSSDAWANPELLRIDRDGRPDAVAGVPPDYFSEDGQLWGNPLYDWPAHAETGYRWWIERLRATVDLADLVRVDHFRGFEGYWAVPTGAENARAGRWEPGPGDAIFDAMRVALGSLPMVAEDLGVITPEVEALRDRHGIPGMVVLQFDVTEEDFSLDDVRDNCVCYTGTHDNDTTLGWFRGSPGDIRTPDEIERARESALAMTGGTPETISRDFIKAAFSTAARLAIAPMQDFLGLGSEARFNTPGRSRDNWRWRLQPEQLSDDLCDNIADTVSVSGRELHHDRVHAAS